MPSINYGELSAGASRGFEPIPLGTYDVEVTGAEYKVASTGSPMYKVEFTINGGPQQGRKLWRNMVLKVENPNAIGAFFAQMRALGLDSAFFAGLPADDAEPLVCQALIGKTATVTLKQSEYNGQQRTEVDRINPSSTPSALTTNPPTSGPLFNAPDLPPGL